jgi:transcription initiation factor TFIIIB Brf1 subunit/transcription initiation factor TFIIB
LKLGKQDEFNSFLRRLLSRFQLWESLRDRVRFLFREAKTRIKFKWGRRAEIFAAACLYVAAKEGNKKLWLLELAVRLSFVLSSPS